MKKVLRISESKLTEIVQKVLLKQEDDIDITEDPKYNELGIEAKKTANDLLVILNKLYKMNNEEMETVYFKTKKIVQSLNYFFGRSNAEIFSYGKHSPDRLDKDEESA